MSSSEDHTPTDVAIDGNESRDRDSDSAAAPPADLEEGVTPTSHSNQTTLDSATSGSTPSDLHQDLIRSKILQDGYVPSSMLGTTAANAGAAGETTPNTADTQTPSSLSDHVAASTETPPSLNPHGLPVATIPNVEQAVEGSSRVYSAKPVQDEDCLVNKKQALMWTVIFAIVVLIVVTTSVVLVKRQNDDAETNVSNVNSQWWTMTNTTIYEFASSLPGDTVRALKKDVATKTKNDNVQFAAAWYETPAWFPQDKWEPKSPQSQAWKWLVSDPRAVSQTANAYTMDELALRFGLAVVFFATNGPNWDNTTSWLSTSTDGEEENDLCLWFSSKVPNNDRYMNEHIRKYDQYVEHCHKNGFQELRLAGNKLVGTIPNEVSMLTALTTLSLNFNELTGTLPSTLTQLTRLETLECYACGLKGNFTTLVDEWSTTLTNLTKLRFPINALRGTIPSSITKLSKLTDLRLYSNRLAGSISDEIWTKWKHMLHIKVNINKITGTLPTLLADMTRLKSLTIDENLITGTMPTQVGKLSLLQQFGFGDNRISGTLPTELGLMTQLQYMYAYWNRFTGTLPTEFGMFGEMLYMDMEGQKRLAGTIPTELALMGKATDCYLGNNFLTGSIPSELALWNASMVAFSFGHNQLTGTIATELATMSQLIAFYAGANKFTGTLPTELGQLSSCGSLDFMDNLFTGTIPTELGNIPVLANLLLALNGFTGSVPDSVCKLFTPTDESKEIQVDCKEVECTCNCTCDNPYDSLLTS
ncbi:hypothetical protein MPSEU_000360100 [Mayamaea pseudoterrestris]|nr:hypothetical protein MPSEU_000360100 [Mayamaea pseudoterrestris]